MPIIEVDHLQKRYGSTVAISDVSFSIEEDEIFGILGPNGAGRPPPSSASRGCASRTPGRSGCSGSTPGPTATSFER